VAIVPPARSENNLIILADDEPITRRLVTYKLEREGYRVIATTNGEELLGVAHSEQPAAIILDIMMPIQDGFSTLNILKKDPVLSSIPTIMLSGKGDEADVLRCLNDGAADYMIKPFSPGELVVRLRKLIASTQPVPETQRES
jgi:DNA-binding response OmpR family regulator